MFDPFEPTWLRRTFQSYPLLGEMTFGAMKWKQLLNKVPDTSSNVKIEDQKAFSDAAAKTFKLNRFTGDKVTIDNSRYEDLYLKWTEMRKKQCQTVFFRLDGKEFWTTMNGPPR